MRDLRHGRAAFGRLAAGHRDRVVVENFVGDVDARRRGGAQRQQSRNASRCRRRGSERYGASLVNGAWPIQFAPSPPMCVIVAVSSARHEQRHAVAADAGHGAAAFRHVGRRVVRAAGAEIGRPLQRHRRARNRRMLKRFKPRQPLFQHRALMAEPAQTRRPGARDHGRRQFAIARQQRRAAFVALADHARTASTRPCCRECGPVGPRQSRAFPRRPAVLQTLRQSVARRSASSGQASPTL